LSVADRTLSRAALLLEKPSGANGLGEAPNVPSKLHLPEYSSGQ